MSSIILLTDSSVSQTDIYDLLKSLIIPFVIIILAIIFRKPIIALFNRIKSGKILGNELEFGPTAQNQQVLQKGNEPLTNIDKAFSAYSNETLSDFRGLVLSETEIDKMENDSQKVDLLIKYSTFIYMRFHFENIYKLIFGSQIQLLQMLNSVKWETMDNVKVHYDLIEAKNAGAFVNFSYDEYLKFLFDYGLIVKDEDRLHITFKGVDFLRFLTDTNKNIFLPL